LEPAIRDRGDHSVARQAMQIPGLPPAGTKQEGYKPDRQPRPTGAQARAQDPLAALPVDQDTSRGTGRQPQPPAHTATADRETDTVQTQPDAAPVAAELPRKGLLVDIRA